MRLFDAIKNAEKQPSAVVAPIPALSRHLDIAEADVQAALKLIIPALTGGFKNGLARHQGVEKLLATLKNGRHNLYLQRAERLAWPKVVADGRRLLGELFSGKSVSRELAQRGAEQTGVNEQTLCDMLPLTAILVLGALRHRARQAGVLGRSSARDLADAKASLLAILNADGERSIIDDLLAPPDDDDDEDNLNSSTRVTKPRLAASR